MVTTYSAPPCGYTPRNATSTTAKETAHAMKNPRNGPRDLVNRNKNNGVSQAASGTVHSGVVNHVSSMATPSQR